MIPLHYSPLHITPPCSMPSVLFRFVLPVVCTEGSLFYSIPSYRIVSYRRGLTARRRLTEPTTPRATGGKISKLGLGPCSWPPLIFPRICATVVSPTIHTSIPPIRPHHHPTPIPPTREKTRKQNAPFLDIRTLSLVPFPPSQNPEPAFPVRAEWQMAQSSGR